MKYIYLSNSDKLAIVDDQDYEKASRYNWYVDGRGYARSKVNGSDLHLHILLVGPSEYGEWDHKNRNKLDCRRDNLRECTHTQNLVNRKTFKNNKSGYKGVSYRASHKKYRAVINFESKHKHLGYFDNPIDAAKAYDRAALFYYGEFANLNFEV